jgi:hypothetical protein
MRHHKSRRGIAVHEAGHAVACLALDMRFSEVAIYTPLNMSDRGVICYGNPPLATGITYDAIHLTMGSMCYGAVTLEIGIEFDSLDWAMGALAGPVAEAKFRKQSLPSVLSSSGRADFEAIDESFDSDTIPYNFKFVERETKKLVALYWDEIVSVADALMLHGTLGWGAVARLAPLACDWKETEKDNLDRRLARYGYKQWLENARTKSAR